MTLEEKLEHLRTNAMEEARTQGNEIIQTHRDALQKIYNDHKEEALRQAEVRIKSETTNARLELNKAMAKSQLNLKREQGKCQNELKARLFEEVRHMLDGYMTTEDYLKNLRSYIVKAAQFANGEPLKIYINASDADKKESLEESTGMELLLSKDDFIGGIRAVIPDRNILIDHSYLSSIEEEYEKFLFSGGDGNAADTTHR